MEPQIVLRIDNNHTLKASNFKIFLGACPQTPLEACDYLASSPGRFFANITARAAGEKYGLVLIVCACALL